jgi:hypothetical protein
LVGATDSLSGRGGRTLLPLEPKPPNAAERLLVGARLVDPQRPGQAEKRITHWIKRLLLAPARALADVPRAVRDALASPRRDRGDTGA